VAELHNSSSIVGLALRVRLVEGCTLVFACDWILRVGGVRRLDLPETQLHNSYIDGLHIPRDGYEIFETLHGAGGRCRALLETVRKQW